MTTPQPPAGRPSSGQFPSTHWSRVVAAGDPARPRPARRSPRSATPTGIPIYAYIRRRGHTPEQAQDSTQDFFAYLLEQDLIARADPGRGRFRSFLRGVCDNHLANRRDRSNARKRGGGRPTLSIDASDAEGRYSREPAHELTPDRIFDRSWALTLLGLVLDKLRREYEEAGGASTFEELRGVLTGGRTAEPYATIAARLDTTEGAVRVAVHRLRRRYGVLLRAEIAATVNDPGEVDDEIRSLFAALQD